MVIHFKHLQLLLLGFTMLCAGCSDISEWKSRMCSNVRLANEILAQNNINTRTRIEAKFRRDPFWAQFSYDHSKKVYALYKNFDLSIRSYEQKHADEIRLISYEQLFEAYESSMDSLMAIRDDFVDAQEEESRTYYDEMLPLVAPSLIYSEAEGDELAITMMRNEIYINSYLLLDILYKNIPDHGTPLY